MSRSEHGFSLVELLIVVTILGIVATVAVPDISTTNASRLGLAAEEIANAMRFARSESIRSGAPRAFIQQSAEKRIRVFRPDTSLSPWSPVYDVYHPLSKQLYDISLAEHSFAAVNTVVDNAVYQGSCNSPNNVYFDNVGTARCTDPETILLKQYDVTLTLGKLTRVVTLNGITGRVSVQ